jgi:hypothetical protein
MTRTEAILRRILRSEAKLEALAKAARRCIRLWQPPNSCKTDTTMGDALHDLSLALDALDDQPPTKKQ